jgi:hypothetical protein
LADGDYEAKDLIIKSAEEYTSGGGWTITTEDSTGFGMPDVPGIEPPEKGDRVRLYTVHGSLILGMALRGTVVFFNTPEEHYAAQEEENRQKDLAKALEWERGGKAEFEERVAALPIEFRRRIAKYMRDPSWGWKFGGYELFCCEQAAVFGRAAMEAAKGDISEAEEYWQGKVDAGLEKPPIPELIWLTWWNALGSAEFNYSPEAKQKRRDLMPDLSDDHSGNTYDFAYALALVWLRPEPEAESGGAGVFKMAGAMAPLVGSERYGDPMTEEALEEAWEEAQAA